MEYHLVLVWLATYLALSLAGLPVASLLFAWLPDRGAALSLPVALALVALVGFWLGHAVFGAATVFVAVTVLFAAAAVLVAAGVRLRLRRYGEAMAVFAVAFGLVVAVRAVDPAVHAGGGEKFLDFGLLKSLMRANRLPPQDMWFAGERVEYYYGGHMIAALLSKLTGTEARYGYNLALAGFYGALVTTAYGLAGAVAEEHGTSRRLAGGLAASFVGFASNLYTPGRLVGWLLPDGATSAVSGAVGVAADELTVSPSGFSYWDASRVIPNTINEFPLFAYLNGDLHAHMMGSPFLLVVAALGFSYYLTPRGRRGRRRALVFGAMPAAVGLLGVISTWSFPAGLGLVWLALVFAPARPRTLLPAGIDRRLAAWEAETGVGTVRSREEVGRTIGATAIAVGVGALSLLWAAPFVLNVLASSAGSRSVGVLPTPSGMDVFLVVHGAFLLVFWLYLLPRARRSMASSRARVGVTAALLFALGWQSHLAAVLLVGPLLIVGWALLRTDYGPDLGFETVLLIAGAGLVLLVEFVYVQDNAVSGRYNTVFKVYMQVWVLWATAAGIALARQISTTDGVGTDWRIPGTSLSRPQAMRGVAAVLVLTTSVYGAFALGTHFASDDPIHRADDPTLDAMAFAETFHPDEGAAIEWLDDRRGQPHIVSAPGGAYEWSSPASSLTGLPTVIGWVHERIYRGDDAYRARANDVEVIYTGPWSDRMALLEKYDVEYIYVGPAERERYGDPTFDRYPGISVAERFGRVTIYELNQSAG